MRSHEIDEKLGERLDKDYRAFVVARAYAVRALSNLISATFALSRSIGEAQADCRMSFLAWCAKYCQAFDFKVARAVTAVAHQTHGRNVETWQLRRLGLVATVHHAERPFSPHRKHKRISWVSYISKSHEEIGKLIERAGGIEKIPLAERQAMVRQLGSFDKLKSQLNNGG